MPRILLLCLLMISGISARAEVRVATLDWTVAETLLALRHPPVAVGDKKSYQVWVGEPSLPERTQDLGLRLQPNKESLAGLTVDLFINGDLFAPVIPALEAVAPVATVNFYRDGDVWRNMEEATINIGRLVENEQEAERLIEHTLQRLEEIKRRIVPYARRPVAIVQFIDTRHLRFYGSRSLFGAVTEKLGLRNAWQGTGGLWGSENMSVTALAELPPDTRLIVVKPHPANVQNALKFNSLWQSLPLSEDPLILPATWTFGALPSAVIFAKRLEEALRNGGEQW